MNKIIAKRIEENDIFYREEGLWVNGNEYTVITKENGSEYISDSFIEKELSSREVAEDWVGWFDSTPDGSFHKGCSNEKPATVADRCFIEGGILIYHKWVN